jgi:molybdopterin-guanine dinucleotide biosynthesis protein A
MADRAGGVVLAGGRSSRMGSPKAALEWHGSTLLRRTVGVVGRAVDGPVVVVRAAGQSLPPLPAGTDVRDDPREGRGPLQGLAVGLAALAEAGTEVAFVCSTDLPFLHPAFVRAVVRAVAEDVDVALPVAQGYPQPTAAGYRTWLAALADKLVENDRLKPAFLFEECRTLRLPDAALVADPLVAAHDPRLASVLNVNQPAEYARARERPAPEVVAECFGALATTRGGRGPRVVRAATLAQAAAALSLSLDEHLLAAVNGDQVTRDPEMPLTAGDTVAFLSADAGG